jgi:sensor histidine kinase YesM
VEIPPMMIQTLVENGIKHGISKKTEGGEILIEA